MVAVQRYRRQQISCTRGNDCGKEVAQVRHVAMAKEAADRRIQIADISEQLEKDSIVPVFLWTEVKH